MVKTLVALALEQVLLKTSGNNFMRGIEFMYAAGLSPNSFSIMMTSSHKYVLSFHSKCDIMPFGKCFPNFGAVLRAIEKFHVWHITSGEFIDVSFYMRDVRHLESVIEKLGVELVVLRNCTYPGVQRGAEAVKLLSVFNRKKKAVVCEYGDHQLKQRVRRHKNKRRTDENELEIRRRPVVLVAPEFPPGIHRPARLNNDQARV